jgi:hypothetical protein
VYKRCLETDKVRANSVDVSDYEHCYLWFFTSIITSISHSRMRVWSGPIVVSIPLIGSARQILQRHLQTRNVIWVLIHENLWTVIGKQYFNETHAVVSSWISYLTPTTFLGSLNTFCDYAGISQDKYYYKSTSLKDTLHEQLMCSPSLVYYRKCGLIMLQSDVFHVDAPW